MLNIALNTFRGLVRSRLLALIMFFSVATILFSVVLASLSLGQTERIVLDFETFDDRDLRPHRRRFRGRPDARSRNRRPHHLPDSLQAHFPPRVRAGKFFGFAMVLAVIYLAETAVLAGLPTYERPHARKALPLRRALFVPQAPRDLRGRALLFDLRRSDALHPLFFGSLRVRAIPPTP